MADKEIKPKGRWAKKKASKKKNLSKPSYRKTGRLRLQDMLKAGLGTKRSKDKAEADTKDKIYSKRTFTTYKNQFRYFADWLEVAHPEAVSIEDALGYVDEYLQHLIDIKRSAYSIATAKAALAKVFGVEATQFIATPPRLRRAEMQRIEAEDLFFENGKAWLKVDKGTKGGKPRKVEICGKTEAETRDLVNWIQSQKGRLFPKLSSNYDNHSYRASYAMRMYKKYVRNLDKLPIKEKYYMRGDRAGEVFDRYAMKIVSENLGHNRITVIAQSYLYTD